MARVPLSNGLKVKSGSRSATFYQPSRLRLIPRDSGDESAARAHTQICRYRNGGRGSMKHNKRTVILSAAVAMFTCHLLSHADFSAADNSARIAQQALSTGSQQHT